MAELQFPPGLSRGATAAERADRWFDADGIRWRDGRMLPTGGTARRTQAPLAAPVRRIMAARDNSDVIRTFLGSDAGIAFLDGDGVVDITPAGWSGVAAGTANGWGVGLWGEGAWGTPRDESDPAFLRASNWAMDSYGGDVVFVNANQGALHRWNAAAPTTLPVAVANAPAGNRGVLVTPERHALLWGAGGVPRRVAWSDRENVAGWDFADRTTQAGFLDLDTEGWLVAAAEVNDGSLVFADSGEVFLIRYVNAPDFYGQQRVGSGMAPIAPAAVATFNGRAAWLGHGSFWLYDNGAAQALPCEVASAVFDDIDPVHGPLKSFAAHNGLFAEIWFHWPSRGAAECDRYAIWNHAEGWWSLGRADRTAMCPAGVHPFPLAAGADRHLLAMEQGWLDAGNSRVGRVWVESGALSPGGQAAVLRGEMDSGTGDPLATRATILARQTREGPQRVFGPYTPDAEGRVAMRAGGADVRLRVEAAKDGAWSVGRVKIDVRPAGQR